MVEETKTAEEIPKKKFSYDGKEFAIDNSGKIRTFADFDERTNTVLVDSNIPEKFFEGLAVHEIEERKLIKKGHSYQFAHNEAQKKELTFYEQKLGNEKAMEIMKEEEGLVLRPTRRKALDKKETGNNTAAVEVEIQSVWLRAIVYENETWIIDNSQKLVGTIVDVWEKGKIIFIDPDVPEKFFEGLAVWQIEERKLIKDGYDYNTARMKANEKELAYYEKELGSKEAATKMMEDEYELFKQKWEDERKGLKDEEHKVIYEKGEILPK